MSILEKELAISGKLERGEELTESEITYFLACMGEPVSEEEGERHRWTEEVHTVTRLNGKLYAVDWERGLTENNENEYPNQPYEVPNSDIPKPTLYLYALTQEENLSGLGHFDACIVCAQSEDEAKLIHPDGRLIWDYEEPEPWRAWAESPEYVRCKLIGTAAEGIEKGVFMARYIPCEVDD